MYIFGKIQYFFKVLKTNFTIHTFSILSIPRENPVVSMVETQRITKLLFSYYSASRGEVLKKM